MMSTPSCERPPERGAPYVSVNQQVPCTGNCLIVVVPGLTVVVVAVVVVVIAPAGRHRTMPGNSAVDVVALLAARRASIETLFFDAISHQPSPATTVYVAPVHVAS